MNALPEIKASQFIIHLDHVEYRGVRVWMWPPRIEPECPLGWAMAEIIAQAQPGEDLWPIVTKLPGPWQVARCMSMHHAWQLVLAFAADEAVATQLRWKRPMILYLLVRGKGGESLWGRMAHLKLAMSQPAPEILKLLGYESTRGMIRLLEKCSRSCVNPRYCAMFFATTADRWALKMLYQLPIITPDALELLHLGRDWCGWELLLEAAQNHGTELNVTWKVEHVRTLWKSVHGEKKWPWRKATFRELTNAEARLSLLVEMATFPAPPLAGTKEILPISTPRSLMHEGKSMQHCAFQLRGKVVMGGLYFYHLTQPRTTIVLFRSAAGYWALYDLRGFKNCAPVPDAWDKVLNWVAEAQGLVGREDVLLNQVELENYGPFDEFEEDGV